MLKDPNRTVIADQFSDNVLDHLQQVAKNQGYETADGK